MDAHQDPRAPRPGERDDPEAVSSHFSWLRTRLSTERTMMSWTRTSISLIGFGFTMVQFFDRLATMQGVEPAKAPDAPRVLGLMLIGAGTLAVIISALQYRSTVRYLWQPRFASIAGTGAKPSHTPMLTVAAVLVLIGLCAFGAVAFRVH